MRRRSIAKPMFVIGDFVFAKVHGYRAWPARVLERKGTPSRFKYKYNVFFYGTCNTARVYSGKVFEFTKNLMSLGALRSKNNKRNAEFRSAMKHARLAFGKPADDFMYYQTLSRTNGGNAVAPKVLVPEESVSPDEEDSQDSSSAVSLKKPQPKAKKHRVEPQGSRVVDSKKKLDEPQPATESEHDTDSDEEDSKDPSSTKSRIKPQPKAKKQRIKPQASRVVDSKKKLDKPKPAKKSVKSMPMLDEPQPAKKPKISMPLVDEPQPANKSVKSVPQLDEPPAKNPKMSMPLLDELDASDNAEAITAPEQERSKDTAIRNSIFGDLESQGGSVPRAAGKLEEDDEDSDEDEIAGYESDEPLNLICRHITADEQ